MANDRPVSMKTKQYRKVVKPLLERRRRARINGCLNELRNFILDATKQDSVQASKLEKADILEMTVHYLRLLLRQRQQQQQRCPASAPASAADVSRFRAGFTECAHEVSLFVAANMSSSSSVNPQVRSRLLGHLSKCLSHLEHPGRPEVTQPDQPAPLSYAEPEELCPDERLPPPPPLYRTTSATQWTTTPTSTSTVDSAVKSKTPTRTAMVVDSSEAVTFQRPTSSSSLDPQHQDHGHGHGHYNGTIVMTVMHRDPLPGSPVWRPW